ncbi:MAG TPA: response regulator FixJ [Xanthobacteraceae bacterium]|jgi:two-component system response regulator FixJ|nr:response regulator FixJ [Xanthobacteraceae bacterium]
MPADAIVHVIDDDQAVRQSIEFLLRTLGMTARSYDSASAFLNALPAIESGCIITDVRMPGVSGIDLLRRLGEMRIKMPVIVITGHGDVPLAVEAMKAGAVDFLEKPFDDEVLIGLVRSALNRSREDAVHEAERAELLARLSNLTNRERQVLEGLIAGKPNKIIAFDLAISPRTVEIYRANVMTKMAAASLSELVRMALITGVMNSGTAD